MQVKLSLSILPFLVWVILASTKMHAACLPEVEGRALLNTVKVTNETAWIAYKQPEIELFYTFDLQPRRVFDTPAPDGFSDFIQVPKGNGKLPEFLCLYPTYQHETILLTHYQNTQNVPGIPLPVKEQNIIQKKSWSNADAKEKEVLASIYFRHFLSYSDPYEFIAQEIWLTALHAYFWLFELDKVSQLISQMDLSKLEDTVLVKVQLIQAQVELHNGRSARALQALDRLKLISAENPLSLNDQIEVLLIESNALLNLNNTNKGKKALDHIESLLRKGSNRKIASNRLLANYYDNLGHLHLSYFYASSPGDPAELLKAIEYEFQGLAIATLSGIKDQQVAIHSNLAWLFKSAWLFESALRNYQLALMQIEGTRDKRNEFLIHRNLGKIMHSLGDYKQAISYFQSAIALSKSQAPKWAAKLRCLMGAAYRESNNLNTAILNQRICLRYLRDHKAGIEEIMEALVELNKSLEKKGAYEELAANAIEISLQLPALQHTGHKNVLSKTKSWLAGYLSKQNLLEKAHELFKEAIEDSSSASDPTLTVSASIQASISFIEHDNELYKLFAEQAINEIEKVFVQLDSAELGPAWNHKIYEFYRILILHLLKKGSYIQAFNMLERSLAVSLRKNDSVSLRNEGGFSGHEYSRLDRVSKLAAKMTSENSSDHDYLNYTIEKHLLQLDMLSDEQEAEFSELNWYKENRENLKNTFTELSPPDSLKRIQSSLTEQQMAIAYFFTNADVYLFSVSAKEHNVINLGSRQTIENTTSNLLSKIRDPDKNVRKDLYRVSKLLLPEGLISSKIKKLYIVPGGLLNQLPFPALRYFQQGISKGSLGSQLHITLIPSFTSLNSDQGLNENPAGDFVMFGDPFFTPEFANIDSQHKTNLDGEWMQSLPRLTHSKKEAGNLAEIFESKKAHFFMQKKATRTNLFSAIARNASILHIATHSYFDKAQPENVGFTLSMSDEWGNEVPSFVTLTELFTQKFNNDLVVINGCETALGRNYSGTGLQGMARGFLTSGADNVIATLWPISDKSSAQFITRFYQRVAEGEAYDSALTKTQKFYSDKGTHPFYWAGYILYSVSRF